MASPEILDAKGLHYLMQITQEWRDKYPKNNHGDIIFQHEPTFANVVFTTKSLHTIQAHSRGVENIPETIMHPDELWSLWEDPKTQRIVIRYYIGIGKVSYVVKTRDGIVMDAFAVGGKAVNKYRKGVLL